MSDVDTTNKFLVGAQGDDVVVLAFKPKMSKQEALNLAAWIVAIVGEREEFDKLLDAVESA